MEDKTLRPLEETKGKYIYDTSIGKDFKNWTQKALIIKEKILKSLKFKKFCSLRDIIKRVKNQATGRK